MIRQYNSRYFQIIFFFLLFGCAANKPIDQTATKRFESVVETWTAQGKIYHDLELLLSASATYLAPEFRSAYVEKYGTDHFLSAAEKDKFAYEEQKKAEGVLEFIVCLYSDQASWNNLADEGTIWTVVLTDKEGHTQKATKINRLDPIPVYITDFFPGMTHWKKVYSVTFPNKTDGSTPFPVVSDARNVTIDFRSALGHLSLAFN